MNLIDRTCDLNVFCTFPKSVKKFGNTGEGCLITALLKAMGLSIAGKIPVNGIVMPYWTDLDGKSFPLPIIFSMLDSLAVNLLGLRMYFTKIRINDAVQGVYIKSFSSAVVCLYDNHETVRALQLMWELIEKLPNKAGYAQIEDVKMPEEMYV